MRMNQETKLLFAIEHILHLEDLIEGNEWEQHLKGSLLEFKFEIERQLHNERARKSKKTKAN
jgi:hypothetical protein|tara:strand:+ start:305 stop:490 length:186 start_codon:yes stop_codon:yes gene_type:complete